jgi:hypothetical protein
LYHYGFEMTIITPTRTRAIASKISSTAHGQSKEYSIPFIVFTA